LIKQNPSVTQGSISPKPNYTTYKQGVIEIIIDHNQLHLKKSVVPYIDSYFLVARNAVNELNKSLSYKMNDNIRIIIGTSTELNSPQTRELSPTLSPTFINANHISPLSSILSTITYSPFLGDMKSQIRYTVAQQYLLEYLGGILMREKLSSTAIQPPSWLILGFCKYFSSPISFSDFEQFSYLARKGKFHNINFIDSFFTCFRFIKLEP
jgi:hypothetical protein